MRKFLIGVSIGALTCAASARAQDEATNARQNVPGAVSSPTGVDNTPRVGESQDQGTSAETPVTDIVVTGSRISRKDYTSASPIVSTSQEALKSSGAVSIEGALNQLPQFIPGSGSGGGGAANTATGGRATLNLRGLGDKRNLILLDGRRLPPSNVFNVIDVNIIPQALVESVETITGGASAVYGSDAISGVVNFRTRRKINGIELDSQLGDTFRGDRRAFQGSVVAGTSLFDDRLHLTGTFDYTKRDELLGAKRSFFDLGILSSFLGTGTFVPSATNLPSQAAVNAAFPGLAPGTVSRTNTLGFNDNGSLFSQSGAFNYLGPVGGDYVTFGNVVRQPVARQSSLERPLERYSAFGKVEFDLSSDITLYAQALYVDTHVRTNPGNSLTQLVVGTVPSTNPFIPASLRAVLDSRPDPTASFSINKRFSELPPRIVDGSFQTSQFILGARGKLGFGDWTFDAYGSRDRNVIETDFDPGVLVSRFNQLLQAPDGGRSLCEGGYNPFGLANAATLSKSCVNFLTARIKQREDIRQTTFEASAQGSLFSLPAGDVKLSIVGTYRENKYAYDPDPQLIAGNVEATNQTNPTRGRTDVKEIAGELFIPLLENKPFFKALNISVGGRYSDYNITGGVKTYKADLEWSPVKPVLFRGGYQRAIRAPNIGELFSSPTGGLATIGNPPTSGDPCDARGVARSGANATQLRSLCVATGVPTALIDTFNFSTVSVVVTNSGNLNLAPETATTKTAGIVLRSPFDAPVLSDLSLSIDAYDISIKNVISTVAGTTAISKCYNQDGSNSAYDPNNQFCRLITRDGTGSISNIALPYLNLGGLKTRGVDIQVDWRINLDQMGLIRNGRLSLNTLVSYLDEYQIKNFAADNFQEFAGTIDANTFLPLPRWRYTTSANLTVGKFDVGLRWRHLNGMKDVTSVTRPTSPAPGVPSYDIFDLTGRIVVSEAYQLRVGITNLFDKAPLVVGGSPGNTLPNTYDILGRSFYVGVKVRF